ncbi:MAG TPA: DNA-binding domain-containing protein [Steroidobacteraceae bacterium]|nr:DNA-binding domain-containing protein [Steroidobacteraceae bacterium]
MPALLEFQRAMRRAITGPEANDLDAWMGANEEAEWRLAVYRDTARSALGNALALSYPAVRRLLGAEFFDGAAQAFVGAQLPQSGCLNDYGEQFAGFLGPFVARHAPTAPLSYLVDVAQLEWAVNRALHAPDRPGLELSRLGSLDQAAMAALRLIAHPSISLLSLQCPADLVWRAVLDQDDAAMAAIDLRSGPVWLLVERTGQPVRVQRLEESAARFTQRLFAGEPLHAALEPEAAEAQQAVLAEHLRSGRIVDFIHEDIF